MTDKKTIFITGAAGYVGAMLVDQLSKRDDVEKIIGLDKEPVPELIAGNPKLVYIQSNTYTDDWQEKVRSLTPDTVIHTAWQIREMYGHQDVEWHWNIDGSDKVFDFAFAEPSVSKLIHFSTVSSYGAFADNSLEHRFTEDESFRKTDYLYAEEKRICEEHLMERYAAALEKGTKVEVVVVRPAAITGPRGRFMRIRFGLQAALSGQLKDSFVYRIVSFMVSFVPVTPKWCRQFIHEDDVTDLVTQLTFTQSGKGYEVFNICPPGPIVQGPDMAKAVGKRTLPVPVPLIRFAFFIFWHLTRGKIPTGRGSWKGYSYPIAVDGSKLTREYGYQYKYESFEAFYYTNGRYESAVPEAARRHNSQS